MLLNTCEKKLMQFFIMDLSQSRKRQKNDEDWSYFLFIFLTLWWNSRHTNVKYLIKILFPKSHKSTFLENTTIFFEMCNGIFWSLSYECQCMIWKKTQPVVTASFVYAVKYTDALIINLCKWIFFVWSSTTLKCIFQFIVISIPCEIRLLPARNSF